MKFSVPEGSPDLNWRAPCDEARRLVTSLNLPTFSAVWSEGRWDGQTYEKRSGVDGSILGDVPLFESRHIDTIVSQARSAFDGKGGWARMSFLERKKCLLAFRAKILETADELSMLDCLDIGKPFQIAKSVDIQSAARSLEWYAELADKHYGSLAPTSNFDLICYEPLGVVAAIVPWNYPIMIAAWKFAPILAAGNVVVLKPAEQSPFSAMRLMELALESGLPPGVFNVVTGDGDLTGDALVQHPGIDGVGFTGSSETGRIVIARANRSRIKPVSLECGGKSPAVLFDDCDVEKAVKSIAGALFYNAGQSCNAPNRILVHRSIFNDVVEVVSREAERYLPNNPLADNSLVGAIVDGVQYEKIVRIVSESIRMGADLIKGTTDRVFPDVGGYYINPIIISNVSQDNPAFQEEIFGPVLPMTVFESDQEAIELCNNSRFGLWANIFTNSVDRTLNCARHIKAGTVAFNVSFGGDITTPFGGIKDSGLGKDRSVFALEKYMNIKHISFVRP